MLNVPGVVSATLLVLGLVHAVCELVLDPRAYVDVLLWFSFIPARYGPVVVPGLPRGLGVETWTFVTYALIHGSLTHLVINAVWLLAFGSAVARRFGAWRFLLFFAVTAAAGAAMHLATHDYERAPMIGASAAISGFMAAAIRFVFQGGGPLGMWTRQEPQAYHVPAAPLRAALSDPRILAFLAAWFGLNILLGLGSLSLAGEDQRVAWQAHIGGFLAGLVLFPLFDPVRRRNKIKDRDADPADLR